MTEVKNLTEYMNVESKPKRNNIPWTPEETRDLLKDASTFYKNDGDPGIECLAIKYERTEKAITIKLSREGWFKANGSGKNPRERAGTNKLKILDYIKEHPYCFCSDIDTMLDVKSSSTLSTLTKDGTINRIKHRGDGKYLYCFNNVTVEDLAEEVITELGTNQKVEPVLAKPTGMAQGTTRMIQPFNIIDRLGKFLSKLIGS